MEFGHCGNCRHVRLRTVTWHLILNLEVVEAFALVEGIDVACTSALSVADQTRLPATPDIICAPWRLVVIRILAVAVLALIITIVVAAVRIVNEALLLEEVFAPSFSLLGVI